jgi:hypothetical protein
LEPPILHRKANDCTGKKLHVFLKHGVRPIVPLDVLPLDAVLLD